MNEIVKIIGGGGHAKVVYQVLSQLGLSASFLVENDYRTGEYFMGQPVKLLFPEQDKEKSTFHCAIGNIVARRRLYDSLKSLGWSPRTIIAPSSSISVSSSLGQGTFVGHGSILNADSTVGDNCIINTASIIEHDCEISDHVNISPRATLCGQVSVGSGSDIGAGAIVLPKLNIGRNCVVGAGAVVVSDLEDGSLVKGVPAK